MDFVFRQTQSAGARRFKMDRLIGIKHEGGKKIITPCTT